MTWYAVYRTSDGVLHSTGEVVADDETLAAAGLEKVVVTANPQVRVKKWNVFTRAFDDATAVKDALTLREFLDRFTEDELGDLLEAASSDNRAVVRKRLRQFFEYIKMSGSVDLNSTRIINAVTAMETANLLSSGRAAIILA